MTDDRVEPSEGSEKTSSTLLARVKARDEEAWRRFLYFYGPLVDRWCRRYGLRDADAADVGQDVFQKVAETIDRFHHDRKGDSLRGWLRSITHTRAIDFLRHKAREANGVGGSAALAKLLEFADGHAECEETKHEDENILIRQAMNLVLDDFKVENRQAFLRVVGGGERPADVARDLGMTVNAVYLAKSHILRRIREEFAHLIDI